MTESTMARPRRRLAGGGDLAIAQLAAGLEVLAVSTYQAAADAPAAVRSVRCRQRSASSWPLP